MKNSYSFKKILIGLILFQIWNPVPAKSTTSQPDPVLFPVSYNYQYGFMDRTGKIIIPLQFNFAADSFADGLAPVQSGSSYGYIDSMGRLLFRQLMITLPNSRKD